MYQEGFSDVPKLCSSQNQMAALTFEEQTY